MKCQRCGYEIEPGEEREYLDQIICEDCYMEALSPARTCDPWAAHSAKSFEKHAGNAGMVTPIQSKILNILKETGGIESHDLHRKIEDELPLEELERELATLHHMEKIGGERKGDRMIWQLWQG